MLNGTAKLAALRERSYSLSHLPDTVRIPPQGGRRDEAVKPIEAATLDNISFAQLGLQKKSFKIYREADAPGAIYQLARKSGTIGAEIAFDAVADAKGGSR